MAAEFEHRLKRPLLAAGGIIAVIFLLVLYDSTYQQPKKFNFHRDKDPASKLRERELPSSSMLDLRFNWTIFITPQDFVGEADHRQRIAIESWLRLDPRPSVVLVGTGIGYDRVAEDYGITLHPHLDMNFMGLPLAGSLVHTALHWPTEISCITDSDILFTQSFVNAIAKIHRHQLLKRHWYFTGIRSDLPFLPDEFHPRSPLFDDYAFTEYVRRSGTLHTEGGLDYFVWNNGQRLVKGAIPPFIRGELLRFDNWLTHEIIQAGFRDVIDGTRAAVVVHVSHNYSAPLGGIITVTQGTSMKDKTLNWMDGTFMHCPWKLLQCFEPSANGMCLTRRVRQHNSVVNTQPEKTLVKGSLQRKNQGKTGKPKGVTTNDMKVYETQEDFNIVARPTKKKPFGLPFTMEDLLPMVARNNTVILTGANYGYRSMLMNFVCNLRRLGLFSNLIIAAFDEDLYKFGFQMGLPVFYYEFTSAITHTNKSDFDYGSKGFRALTKVKSQVVLDILRHGYDVLWTDSDNVWFQNPLPIISEMPSDFVVQSNAPWPAEEADNGPLRINSGFYRIRSKPSTIAALQAIVDHARQSTLSEQPSFYMVLCGGKEGKTVKGPSACVYQPEDNTLEPLEVQYLNRQIFPNGAVGDLWAVANRIPFDHPSLMVLHNNWIKGLEGKMGRQTSNGFWWWSVEEQVCNCLH